MDIIDLTNSPEFQIRYTDANDESELKQILSDPRILPFFPMSDEKEVDDMVKIWIGYSRYKCCLTALYQGQVVGFGALFLMPYVKLIHHSMVYLVVDPEFQRKGVGTSLVRNLDHLAKNYFKIQRMQYEVFGKTPLIELLEKQGYQQIFTQNRYVKDGDHYLPRIILEKVL